MNTKQIVGPILTKTYGQDPIVDALADHLATKIDANDYDSREDMILLTCWNWFPGGDTAASVTTKIETELKAAFDEDDRG